MTPPLDINEEVRDALADRRPVVALESSLIAHGPGYPLNVEIATGIEKAVRDAGAVPATIGIVDGRFVVGMDDTTIDRFGRSGDIAKVSARDLGLVLARGDLGATTVASTIVIAQLAGIPVFSTAGIGGVHRGVQQTLDISADLQQFTRTRIVVVCAGAKSILDLPKTVEYLETAGVPVLGYRFDEFPAFYARNSGIPVTRVDEMETAARAARLHWDLNGDSTVLLTAPIPEEDALPQEDIDNAVGDALTEAERSGITGNALSPFLMKAVVEATGGRSGKATKAVLISNARLSGELAVAMSATGEQG
ncbi:MULTISPECIES: pseudouridine-5'-phosphate glycosidase [Streptomonospora]|uniref:Pseudouridine-5'-phosphate glycosidase n=2 Tax=Streptomonospora TaxID=104204 RepID=A0ABV9SQD2_9ACTN